MRFHKKTLPLHPLNRTKVDSLAQQVEHIPFKDGVLGSSPKRITKKEGTFLSPFLFFVFYPRTILLYLRFDDYLIQVVGDVIDTLLLR